VNAVEDVAGLLEYASTRLQDRMAGLTDAEWAWQPVAGDALVTIRWRLDHIAEALGEGRNWEWLGADPSDAPTLAPAASADAAVATVADATARVAALARGLGADSAEPLGAVAGPYGEDSRLSFVLHVVDELVHHAAEAALIRDLYAAAPRNGFDA
jgi:hypothetical protein